MSAPLPVECKIISIAVLLIAVGIAGDQFFDFPRWASITGSTGAGAAVTSMISLLIREAWGLL
jgi:hypothetical protein